MSGPVATDDASPAPEPPDQAAGPVVEVTPGRVTQVGSLTVRRVLPQRARRTVGSWCFADHVGPVAAQPGGAFGIGPHPHLGLRTVTWLVSGELLHLDSLGSEQLIRPGQLNLITAGHGVSHAEEDPARAEEIHAVQLWVARPAGTRDDPAALERHAELPHLELGGGEGTVLVGTFGGLESPLRPDDAHALVVLQCRVTVDGVAVEPGVLAYLGLGRDQCAFGVDAPARALLLGGVPFPEPILMWWNFVGPSREELSEARQQWTADDGRFGHVRSSLSRIEVGRPPWE